MSLIATSVIEVNGYVPQKLSVIDLIMSELVRSLWNLWVAKVLLRIKAMLCVQYFVDWKNDVSTVLWFDVPVRINLHIYMKSYELIAD